MHKVAKHPLKGDSPSVALPVGISFPYDLTSRLFACLLSVQFFPCSIAQSLGALKLTCLEFEISQFVLETISTSNQ
jgi:hypothetical protein